VFERFTQRAREALSLAQEEARLLNHDFIGTEHLLLGLIREGDGVAAKALKQLGISLEPVRGKIEETMGVPSTAAGGVAPFTPRAKKVLELSLREALQLGHNYIGTEHILLGLVREGEGVAARVLVDLGADLFRVRLQVMGLISGRPTVTPPTRPGPPVDTGRLFPPSGSPPDCPYCRASLAASAGTRLMDLVDEASGVSHAFVVVYCSSCGASLAFNPTT
jgi:ATP-dependent Clp protease ATP-binding subunit ClpC